MFYKYSIIDDYLRPLPQPRRSRSKKEEEKEE